MFVYVVNPLEYIEKQYNCIIFAQLHR